MHVPPLIEIFKSVLHASWQGSLAIALVLAVRWILGARVAVRWRCLFWILVLVRLLIPAAVLPHSATSLENVPVLARPLEQLQPVFPPSPEPPTDSVKTDAVPRINAAPASSVKAHTLPDPYFWWKAAAAIWIIGMVAMAGRICIAIALLDRRVRRGTFAPDAEIETVWKESCIRWLGQRAPRLRVADWILSPALVGFGAPQFLIPRRMLGIFSREDWEHVFAHEIAHLRWRDHWAQMLLLVAHCVHWFNPLVWLALKRMRLDRELAADDWVLRRLRSEDHLSYGETLLRALSSHSKQILCQPGLVGISEDGSQMKQRLTRITAFLPRSGGILSLPAIAATIVLGLLVLSQAISKPAESSAQKTGAVDSSKSSVQATAATAQQFQANLLKAAKAGDHAEVARLLDASFGPPSMFSSDAARSMLDDLARGGDLTTFVTMDDELRKTNYGKDWKISDALLAGLIQAKRTDFIDALLARDLDLKQLRQLAKAADPQTAAWISQRADATEKQRSMVEDLEKAAGAGDLAAIRKLLDQGADVNGVGKDHNTPLLRAVFKNQLAAAQLLLDKGAEVDKPRFPGWDYTPLCLVESVPMAELLKKNGANVHAKLFRRNVSILTYVATFGSADLVAWFLRQGLDPKMIGDNNENLLFELKDPRTAELLLKAGVDPNHADNSGETPICSARSAEVAQVLIDHGAKVTGFKEPLLLNMVAFASAGAVEVALKAGADHDPETLQRALITAAHRDNPDTARVLIKYGAKVNELVCLSKEANFYELPLEVCVTSGSTKTAEVLLEAGADPNIGKVGGGMLNVAARNRHKDLARLLRKFGAKGVADLAFAISTNDTATISRLLKDAPSYAASPAFWDGALPAAARVGNVKVVQAALDHGVPPAPSADKNDAYAAAAYEGQDETLALLLDARKSLHDTSPLHPALWDAVWNCHPYSWQRSREHFERCVRMLLDAGATKGNNPDDQLMAIAVFTRNPGGNEIVMEMLAQAGVDANPIVDNRGSRQIRLMEAVQDSYKKGNSDAPLVETLAKLNKLTDPVAK
jgi:bla regulator protein BlaR1